MEKGIMGAPPAPGSLAAQQQEIAQHLEAIARMSSELSGLGQQLAQTLHQLPHRKSHHTALYYLGALQSALDKVVIEHARTAQR